MSTERADTTDEKTEIYTEPEAPDSDSCAETDESNRKKEIIRAVKFALFSASAGIIQAMTIMAFETVTPLPSWACYLCGLSLSVLWNFTLNRKFTFQSATNVPVAMLKVAAYYAVFTPLSTLGVRYLTQTCGWRAAFADALAMGTNLITEFLFQRFVVFGKSLDTAVKKEGANENTGADDLMLY